MTHEYQNITHQGPVASICGDKQHGRTSNACVTLSAYRAPICIDGMQNKTQIYRDIYVSMTILIQSGHYNIPILNHLKIH
jgi:hypothetical protein